MPKFRKKPVVIEAMQFVGGLNSFHEIQKWATKYHVAIIWQSYHDTLFIPTLEGEMTASVGDWIIKGVGDEFYPCKPDIFEATYDAMDDETDYHGEGTA